MANTKECQTGKRNWKFLQEQLIPNWAILVPFTVEGDVYTALNYILGR